jgi:hypothetical protein
MTTTKTLEQIKNELMELLSSGKTNNENDPIGLDYVIIRTYSAGVHAGFLVEENNQRITLTKARRIRNWDGAFTLSELAKDGTNKPENCRFSVELEIIHLLEAIEIIPTTKKARLSIRGVKAHETN